jgi:polar amino acid transport system substrate-binding protein
MATLGVALGLFDRGALIGVPMVFLAAMQASLADAASLKEVQQSGSLRLCANPNALPYSNRSSPGGPPGFQVELAAAVAREMGLGLAIAWIRTTSAAGKAGCDASMDSIPLAASYPREGRIGPLMGNLLPLRFTQPYAASGVFLAIPSDSQARRFEDLHDQKIGVIVGSVEHEWLTNKAMRVSVFAFQEEIVAAVDAGEIGGGAVPQPILGWYRHEHPGARVTIPDGYEPEPALRWNVAVGLWRADDALISVVDAALDRVMDKQIPRQIYAKYGAAYHPPFGVSEQPPFR